MPVECWLFVLLGEQLVAASQKHKVEVEVDVHLQCLASALGQHYPLSAEYFS